MNNDELVELLYKRINDQPLTDDEHHALQQWLHESPDNQALYEQHLSQGQRAELYRSIITSQRKVEQAVMRRISADERKGRSPLRKLFPYWAAAVAVICAVSLILYLPAPKPKHAAENILPGTNKAMLILGDGSSIVLDTGSTGVLTQQGRATLVQGAGGQLSYHNTKDGRDVVYNTISTSRGNLYKVALSDGSKVWLNADTKLRFPASFRVDGNREVELLQGEAYFEVTPDKKRPFIVSVPSGNNSPDMTITVLGTHFNISAYTADRHIFTTLVEGKVRVGKGKATGFLQPGQQSSVPLDTEEMKIADNVNVELAISWTKGIFQFQHENIGSVMRKLSRWYDVDIEYKAPIPANADLYSGIISQSTSLEEILQILSSTKIKFTVVGRKIIVEP